MVFEDIALKVPIMLLPAPGTDMTRWSVVACDQHTSQPEYWGEVERLVKEHPSTYRMVLPELFLQSQDRPELVEGIHATMKSYLASGVLLPQPPGFILVDRSTPRCESRKGLMVALDLEKYDYSRDAQALIRATEKTIVDRLPPRIGIRKDAPLEVPHTIVLIDDPDRTVIEPLLHEHPRKVYDFNLNMNGGHIRGYLIDAPERIGRVARALAELATPESCAARYGSDHAASPMLYAMGDGNHSFAAAKAVWEEIKSEAPDKEAVMDHPARYSLVELINIHDSGLIFEPIHRVVFGIDAADLLKDFQSCLAPRETTISHFDDLARAILASSTMEAPSGSHCIVCIAEQGVHLLTIRNPSHMLPVESLHAFLDPYLANRPNASMDFIHGTDAAASLGRRPGNIGLCLPALAKSELPKRVLAHGPLPGKTFSLGDAEEKRFYLECRRITED